MATKRKSIIEEALLEAKSLEDALKANTKEILATHMKQEIETIVESSLKEQEDEELEIDADIEGSDEEIIPAEEDAGDDSEIAVGDEELELEIPDEEIDIDLDSISGEEGGEGIDLDLDVAELPIDFDLGDETEIDLTDQPDEEVLKVFKAMGDEDEVEVVKDGDGITLTDNETGAEYYIKESEQLEEDDVCEGCGDDVVYEIELDEHQDFADRRRERREMRKHYGETPDGFDDPLGHSDQGYDDRMDDILGGEHGHLEEDQGYDDEEDESLGMRTGKELEEEESYKDRREDSYGKWGKRGKENRGISLEEEELEEDRIQRHQKGGYQRKSGAKVGSNQASPYGGRYSESRKSRKSISGNRKSPRNISQVSNSKIVKEYKELKLKNEEYKEALTLFKDKLNEVALFNTNLAYVNRLFTEHSTTKKEKMNILKRFDNTDSIKSSKNIYKVIKTELDNNTPITESVGNRVNKTVKSSASDLNESTAYVDPQIVAIKDLMKRIS